MTNPYTYATQQWREAFEAAEGAEWDEIDASEHGGEVARLVAVLYTTDLVDKDEGRLYAAITVAGDEADVFNQEFLEKVLNSYRGESEDNLNKVATDYIEETWPGFPIEAITSLEEFANKYAIRETEACAPDQHGGTLHYFDTNKW
ncbi:hypothetical protein [Streptomyces sp. NBC_00439]|uniref:hypothetical protein n=1 Tax=Streptomyces sp. NBC_00439 TaxID=2903650 RepID=UPI002255B0EF|nr:hypothetical protein [Streptomyces sp. NBC_00439]MCX5103474.1 hypothetical protein [Streptomyces sp. NBC_00439]